MIIIDDFMMNEIFFPSKKRETSDSSLVASVFLNWEPEKLKIVSIDLGNSEISWWGPYIYRDIRSIKM